MKTLTTQTLKIYWQNSWRYKVSGFLIVVSIGGAAVAGVTIPLYFKKFFDILAENAGRDLAVKDLIAVLMVIALLEAANWLCWRIATFMASYFQSKIINDLSNYCFAYLHKHSFAFFSSSFVGSLVKKVRWFSRAFEDITDRFFWTLLPLIINITLIIIVLFTRNLFLGLGMVLWVLLFLTINGVFTAYKLKYDILRNEVESKTTGFLADTITNQTTVKLFGGYQREVKGFARLTGELRRLTKFSWNLDATFEAIQGGLMVVLEIGIFYLAIKLWQKAVLTVGDFVLIQAYLVNLFMRVWDFGRALRSIYTSLADAEEMTRILMTPHEIKDIPSAKVLIVKEGKIEFKNVGFYYSQTRKILDKFNLTIAPKEHLALIGSSGAGKTTLVKLLLRMHDVTDGEILIDGQNIAKVTQESLWQNISLVPQDPILFHRTLQENISYGKPDATDKEVEQAARLAHCHEFISKAPDGYQTYVGERGIKLSSGERQRVAIARAILRAAPILILDEATSSLDSESEKLIQDALNNLILGKTVLVIAHRLSTIKKMDRIVVIEGGQIAEAGSHIELTKKPTGLYKKLWDLQVGGFIR